MKYMISGKFICSIKIKVLVLICIHSMFAQAQNIGSETKFQLLDSNALINTNQIIILYQTKQHTVFTSDKIFYPEFQKMLESQPDNEFFMAIQDSLKKDTLLQTINLEDITYSIRKIKAFLMHELMLGKVMIYNKYSKKLENHVMYKGWSFMKPYNGYAQSYRIGKTEIYKIEEPWY